MRSPRLVQNNIHSLFIKIFYRFILVLRPHDGQVAYCAVPSYVHRRPQLEQLSLVLISFDKSTREQKCGSTPPSMSIRKSCSTHDFFSTAGPSPQRFLQELKEEHRVSDAEFLVDGIGYLIALAKTDLTGDLNYSEYSIVKKLFQTCTMRIGRFHETWNGSQPNARRLVDCLYRPLRSATESSSPGELDIDRSSPAEGINLAVPR